jgi:hypothetical protein
LRRQTESGAIAFAGSSRIARLDPRALPLRFAAEDTRADGRTRTVEIDHARVLVERKVRGIAMRLQVPLSGFLGVSVRRVDRRENEEPVIALTLEHRDPSLSVPLMLAPDSEDFIADWRLWADALGRPLLLAGPDGSLSTVSAALGALEVGASVARRRRRTALKFRGPRFAARRATLQLEGKPAVHRGEREIIAPE